MLCLSIAMPDRQRGKDNLVTFYGDFYKLDTAENLKENTITIGI